MSVLFAATADPGDDNKFTQREFCIDIFSGCYLLRLSAPGICHYLFFFPWALRSFDGPLEIGGGKGVEL